MKYKNAFLLLILFLALYAGTPCKAQGTVIHTVSKPTTGTVSTADSLLTGIDNAIYYSYYNPGFWSKATKPIFTILKIDIDKEGHVGTIRYSDSADSLFANTYLKKVTFPDEKVKIEKYAKIKSYTNTSIVIPVSYEPNYGPGCRVDYESIESMLTFNKEAFTGAVILLAPIHIQVLSHGNK